MPDSYETRLGRLKEVAQGVFGPVVQLINKVMGKDTGAILFTFEFSPDRDGASAFVYTSNGRREDILVMLSEWLRRQRAGESLAGDMPMGVTLMEADASKASRLEHLELAVRHLTGAMDAENPHWRDGFEGCSLSEEERALGVAWKDLMRLSGMEQAT